MSSPSELALNVSTDEAAAMLGLIAQHVQEAGHLDIDLGDQHPLVLLRSKILASLKVSDPELSLMHLI